MLTIPLYEVVAFAERPFAGNPAAVCPMPAFADDAVLQGIAAENNLSETAFLVKDGEDYRLRWFTPAVEVPLCRHATLASGWVVLNELEPERREVRFHTLSGVLTVRRDGDRLTMDLPAAPPAPAEPPPGLVEALGVVPEAVLKSTCWMAVYASPEQVAALSPDMARLAAIADGWVAATAPGGDGTDFVSRFFAPSAGIPEDPATGSAHCVLAPYWAGRLGRNPLRARQISARGGDFGCEVSGDRVVLTGACAFYMAGTIRLG